MNNCSGSINLLALKHAKWEADGQDGKVKCIIIPIEANHLEVRDQDQTPKLNIKFNIVPTPDKDQDGFIAQQGLKKWSEMTDQEKEVKLPILGNIKEWGQSDGVNNAVSDKEFKEGDKLPF